MNTSLPGHHAPKPVSMKTVERRKEDFTRSGQRYDLILDMGGNRSLSSGVSSACVGGTAGWSDC
jgi:hypothetical protein